MSLLYSSSKGLDTGTIVAIVIALLALAAIPAIIAKNRGHSAFGYYMFGIICLPAAIMTACLLPRWDEKTGLQIEHLHIINSLENLQAEIRNAQMMQTAVSQCSAEADKSSDEQQDEETVKNDASVEITDDVIVCNHNDVPKVRYMIYKGNELYARRDLCNDCARRIKQLGIHIFKA